MNRRGDLMERLAAADPLPDAERLNPEDQREADALLASLLAGPTEDHAAEPRPWRPRRFAVAAAGALCAAAAAFAAINLLDSDTPGPGVIEKAVAAVTGEGAVYHVLQRGSGSSTGIPEQRRQSFYFESWHTPDGRTHRKTFEAEPGRRVRLLEDWAGRRLPGRRGGPLLRWDARSNTIYAGGFAVGSGTKGAPRIDPFGDPGATLRALEREGRLRVDGTVQVGDRVAYRLVSGVVPGPTDGEEESVEFLVDSETYLPLAQRYWVRFGSAKPSTYRFRYLVYERLPLNSRTRAQLDLDPHPGAKCSPGTANLKGRRAAIGFPNPCAR